MSIGPKELLFIAAAIMVLFGIRQIPSFVKGVSESIRIVRQAVKGDAATKKTEEGKG